MAQTKAGKRAKRVKVARPVKAIAAIPRPTHTPKYEGLTKEQAAYLSDLLKQERAPMLDNAVRVVATFWKQNNFTIVRLFVWMADQRLKPIELVGVTKRNPNDDEESRSRAARIALARAARGEAQVESA